MEIAMKRQDFFAYLVISEVGSPDYIAKSAIFKIWVFWVISMHYITLFVIDIHNIRWLYPFYHSMTTLKFGGFGFGTETISWNLVLGKVSMPQFFMCFAQQLPPSYLHIWRIFPSLSSRAPRFSSSRRHQGLGEWRGQTAKSWSRNETNRWYQ